MLPELDATEHLRSEALPHWRPDWDTFNMAIAAVASSKSHDPDTRHGCTINNAQHRILGIGFNGFPRGGDEYLYPITRPAKYKFMAHSERNAISNCSIRPPEGATAYITGFPCSVCMIEMIQNGVKHIVYGQVGSACIDEADAKATLLMAYNHDVTMTEMKGDPSRVFLEVMKYLVGKGWSKLPLDKIEELLAFFKEERHGEETCQSSH